MKCQDFELQLDAYSNGDLAPLQQQQMAAHASQCTACRQSQVQHHIYCKAAAAFSTPELRGASKARLLHTLNNGYSNQTPAKSHAFKNFAGGFAAASMLAIALFIGHNATQTQAPTGFQQFVSYEEDLQREITIVINAPADMNSAELVLNLPSDMSIVGEDYLDQIQLSVDLKKGANQITLPVMIEPYAIYADSIALAASLNYKNQQKTFSLNVELDTPQDEAHKLIQHKPNAKPHHFV